MKKFEIFKKDFFWYLRDIMGDEDIKEVKFIFNKAVNTSLKKINDKEFMNDYESFKR